MTVKELINALIAYVEHNGSLDEEVIFQNCNGVNYPILSITEGCKMEEHEAFQCCWLLEAECTQQ